MHFSTLVYNLALMSSAGLAQYYLEDDYFGSGNFFGEFSFWDSSDPTHGFVSYQGQSAAQQQGLISGGSSTAYMGVDHTNNAPNGRNSVRLTSNKSYNQGLVIVDIEHMPGGVCGTWPAFWMVGPNWPYDGEIDIIEGVNQQNQNDMTLHTGPNCQIANNGGFTGSMTSTTCNSANGNNNGCQIQDGNTNSYGQGFNNNGGGVYATEITDSAINIWFFQRGSIPSDISSSSPQPGNWGTPLASFYGSSCNIGSNFQQLQIVFDTTFCGDWAGNVWGSSSCASQASSCNAFVENNPSAFQNAYWTVNALKVYQASTNGNFTGGSGDASPAPSSTGSTPVVAGNGPIGANDLSPSAPAPTTPASTPAPTTPTPVAGSGPLGVGVFAPPPSPTATAVVPADGGQNAVAPNTGSSPSSNDNNNNNNNGGGTTTNSAPAAAPSGNYAPVTAANGVISEELEPARRARLARHLRQHKARHATRF